MLVEQLKAVTVTDVNAVLQWCCETIEFEAQRKFACSEEVAKAESKHAAPNGVDVVDGHPSGNCGESYQALAM